MKKIYLTMILSLAWSPLLALGQEPEDPAQIVIVEESTTTVEVSDDATSTDTETTTEEEEEEEMIVEEDTTVDNDTTVEDDTTLTEEELQEIIDESSPITDYPEDTVVIDGEVVATEDGVVYIETEDGSIVSFDTTEDNNVIIRSHSGGKKKKTIVVSSGDKITLLSGGEVTISQELKGTIVKIVNDMITIALADGTEKTVRVHSSASYVNAQGNKVNTADMQVGDEVMVAADENDDAYQVITGSPDELEELQADTSDGWLPRWAIWVGILLAAVLAWFAFKK